MPKNIISLKALISALSRSFSTAQEELTWSQLSSLLDFFHKDGTPKNLKFTLPKESDDHSGNAAGNALSPETTEQYEAPVLSLIAPSPLHIAEGKLEFNVAITDVSYRQSYDIGNKERFLDLGGHDGLDVEGESDNLPADIMVDTSTRRSDQMSNLKIIMKVKAAPHQDGYDRLISKMSQLHGVWDEK